MRHTAQRLPLPRPTTRKLKIIAHSLRVRTLVCLAGQLDPFGFPSLVLHIDYPYYRVISIVFSFIGTIIDCPVS